MPAPAFPSPDAPPVTEVSRHRSVRAAWMAVGFVAVALGAVGVVVPGLPTTGFFVLAAWAFSRSSPRFEQWVLGLPAIGPMVRDHREGLGMPRRAKVLACSMIVVACTLSAVVGLDRWGLRIAVVALGLVGVAWILWRIPTREVIVAARAGR